MPGFNANSDLAVVKDFKFGDFHAHPAHARQLHEPARQLAARATHWLLDEPFAALDERTRHRLQALLLDLRGSDGLSMLFVTHSIE